MNFNFIIKTWIQKILIKDLDNYDFYLSVKKTKSFAESLVIVFI